LAVKNDKKKMHIISNYEHYDRFEKGLTDYPYSLMMGLAGDLHFEADLLDLKPNFNAAFPGYEI
jgi:hypothetical protein